MIDDLTPEVRLYIQEHSEELGRITKDIRALNGSPSTVALAITLRLDGGSLIDALTIDAEIFRRCSSALAEFYEANKRDLRGANWLLMAQREGSTGLFFAIIKVEDLVTL